MNDTFRIAIVARMKHGVLYEAIRKKGWTNKQAAEFLGIDQCQIGLMVNMKGRPPYLFPKTRTTKYKEKAKNLSKKLMEFTGMSVEELFPEEFMTDEFLSRSKILEGIKDIPKQMLLGSGAIPQILPAPDEVLLRKEAEQELFDMVKELPLAQRRVVEGLYFEGKTKEILSKELGIGVKAVFASASRGSDYLAKRIKHRVSTEEKQPWLDCSLIKGRGR